ncbi:(Fe-S)-binding protein [Sulfuricaulis sp.]|uniref:(Fe-S)-binding protein n=1 Tax=Sulfuricaulis sp. TaxID=2003553 RepID=UPI00355A075A
MTSAAMLATAGLFMTGLGVSLAALLSAANKKLYVYEDPRIDEVEALLPRNNCGACGTAGCRAFAEAAIRGDIAPGQCTVCTPAQAQTIASLLAVTVGAQEKRVARIACAGGRQVAINRARYAGLESCRAAHLVAGGGKGCAWGCLGFGDCVDVCDFDAIHMDPFQLPVVHDAYCIACNDCIEVCPKNLISLQNESCKLWVACSNRDFGAEAEAQCEVICNACGRCVADAPAELIAIKENLAVIDYTKNVRATRDAIERCPTGAIVWMESGEKVIKGRRAAKILRKEALPVEKTP